MQNEIYYELRVASESHLGLFLDFIETIFDDAIEIGEKEIVIRYSAPLEDIEWGVKEYASALSLKLKKDIKIDICLTKKRNEDWIQKYKESIKPVEVGEFYIHPSWQKPSRGKRNIMIDPALAFGSGHHETTASCIEVLSDLVKGGETLLDVGCGSGVLGIAASMLGATVDACDTDPLAVENTIKNFSINGQEPRAVWEGSVNEISKKYDIVVANIVADILCMVSKELKSSLKSGGYLVLSGILDSKEKVVSDSFGDLALIDTIAKNEWRTRIYKKI